VTTIVRKLAGAATALALSGCVTSGGLLDGFTGSFSGDGGPEVFREMTDADVNMANNALDSALESRISGASVAWRNPGSGNEGRVTPLATFRASDGSYCRRYREELLVAGRRARYEDVACRRGRRKWVPLEST
jgi:surface antigen